MLYAAVTETSCYFVWAVARLYLRISRCHGAGPKDDDVPAFHGGADELRAMAIVLLASLSHSTQRCRADVLAADGPAILLELLREQVS